MNVKTEFKLTQSQANALTRMKDFVSYPGDRFFRLTGYAGTGKTFVICQLVKWLQKNKYQIALASPTNKAAKNLQGMAFENNLVGIDVTTVAKLLGQQAVLDEKIGKEVFVSKNDENIGDNDVIILDEFSMVNQDNFTDIRLAVENSIRTKVIFVGDGAQLPPVKEKEPIVLTHPAIRRSADLTEVVRYDGELAKVAEEIRSDRKYNQVLYPFKTSEDNSIVCLDRYEWLEKASELFASKEFEDNPNLVRFLVWRNKQADILNAYVRKAIWERSISALDQINVYEPGDRLIAKTPVFRTATYFTADGKEKEGWQIIINSSEECVVSTPLVFSRDRVYGWEYYEVGIQTDDCLNFDLRILTENGLKAQQELLAELKKQKKWRKFYDVFKSFDNIAHAYSITTHKAQGSSIDYAFVDIADMKGCGDLQKILYTAVTRTKKTLFVPH